MLPASFFIRTTNPTQAVLYFVLANIECQLCARPCGAGRCPRHALVLHLLSLLETVTTAIDQGHTLPTPAAVASHHCLWEPIKN